MFINPAYHGAVEDFGLLKIEEDVLQLPNSMPATEQFYSTNLICHEVAHVYFGNIVTADKWTDLWLHESVASYLSFRTMSAFVNEPDYVVIKFWDLK
jgi:aminopeptidase N